MISPNEFKKLWEAGIETIEFDDDDEYFEGLIHCKEDCPALSHLPKDISIFLSEAGLPDSAAPFLAFDSIGKHGLEKIYNLWARPSDFSHEEKEFLDQYLVIGSDGAGSPLAIDIENDFQVVHIDHDDWFRTVTFVNASIPQFLEFLLIVREMIYDFNELDLERDSDDQIPEDFKSKYISKIKSVDAKAIESGNFWLQEIGML